MRPKVTRASIMIFRTESAPHIRRRYVRNSGMLLGAAGGCVATHSSYGKVAMTVCAANHRLCQQSLHGKISFCQPHRATYPGA